jgi:chaperonin GroEL
MLLTTECVLSDIKEEKGGGGMPDMSGMGGGMGGMM